MLIPTSAEKFITSLVPPKLKVIRLKIMLDGIELYQAGLPHFPRNFARDSIISSILLRDEKMLSNQLAFCSLKQGKKQNPLTGEEPGKIFHEYPGVGINGRSTEYNACDTTALYLIGHEVYQRLNGDTTLATTYRPNIEQAAQYILSHLDSGLFFEDPRLSKAEDFALKVTYWKDSEILGRENGKPKYPVVYTLAHVQNMRGLRAAAHLLDSESIRSEAERMRRNLWELFDWETGTFYVAKDSTGPIRAISSDALHMLFYLELNDLMPSMLEGIVNSSKELKVSIGYRAMSAASSSKVNDQYHASKVWAYEQALIHAGAKKFGLGEIQEASSRIAPIIATSAPETIDTEDLKKSGCDPQLWTIAARHYFNSSHNGLLL